MPGRNAYLDGLLDRLSRGFLANAFRVALKPLEVVRMRFAGGFAEL
jgi:hypothetical protein